MKGCNPTLRELPAPILGGLFLLLCAFPLAASGPPVTQETLDRIQRACLRSYTPEMLRSMTSGATGKIPAEVEQNPEQQPDFLAEVLKLEKGLFYPILLEDMLPAFEQYIRPGDRFLDLGSGDGRAVFLANALGANATGIEYDKLMFKTSERALANLGGVVDKKRVRLLKNDFFKESWSGYDVVYYFDIGSFHHDRLREKIARELDQGARLLVAHQQAPFPGLSLETTFESIHVYRQPVASLRDPTFSQRCQQEVLDLHQFLEDWYNGAIEPGDKNLARFDDVLAPSFLLIGAEGHTTSRKTLLQAMHRLHGAWRIPESTAPGTGRIQIKNFRLRLVEGAVAVADYEEWREFGESVRGRQSTVVFRLEQGQPNGVTWYHLHETWLPESRTP